MTEPREIRAGDVTGTPNAQVVQPQPTPETFQVTPLDNGSVLMVISSFSGQHVSFLPADNAVGIGELLVNAGRQAKCGLIIPTVGVQLPPNGGPQH